jgi:DAACS family dicarboxylate/amino acid:cation (Na+ or H+) symporter
MSLHSRILLGLVFGAIAGVATNLVAPGSQVTERVVGLVTEPVGKIWLSCLIMVVIPLIVSSLAMGVANLGDLRKLGRMGALTLVSFLCLTTLATVLGLAIMNVLRPGDDLDPEVKTRLMEAYQKEVEGAMGLSGTTFGIDLLVKIVPRNPIKAAADGDMLAVIFFTLVLGAALASLPRDQARPLMEVLESLGHVTVAIIHMVMTLAPLGVFCLIYSVTARFGFDLLVSLLKYVTTVVGGLAFMFVAGYSLVLWFVARRSPWDFFRKIRLVVLTAFSTSSSNATLPTTIEVAQKELGISPEIAGFVLPLGATLNMNGTALYEGATVLFLAQVFGVPLGLVEQLIVVLLSVVTAIGVAGVPGGSIPLLMMVLGMVGIPMEAIAIILGVDRLLDMCRTVLNVTGDLVTATIVARVEEARKGTGPICRNGP